MNPMWADIDTSESPIIIIYLRPSPSRFLETEEKQWCVITSHSTPNNDTANLSATTGFIFPNDHSQQQQQHLVLEFIQTHEIPNFFFLLHPDWKTGMREVGEETTMEDVYFRRYPRWINDSREWGFISSFTGKVSFKFAYRPSTIPLRRYQITTIPYTNNNGHGPGHHSHILLAALQQLRAYCSLLTSISIPTSISNSYALHRYRLGFTATKSCLLPATGSTFLSWSGVTL